MRILVSYSGGKDSQACLIWSKNKFGKNIEAVFCDTGHESKITYDHITNTCNDLDIKLHVIKSNKYKNFMQLAESKKRFPSTMARFCTSELKSKPMIDFIIDKIKDDVLIIQGIRADESLNRSKMKSQCKFFKYYFEAYNAKGRKHNYRHTAVKEFCSKYSDDVLRPVFNWTSQQVIDYIIENGHQPNPLYSQGFKRVGCFPCILSGHREVFEFIKRYPERFNWIKEQEIKLGSSFFKIDFVPTYAQSGICHRTGKKFTTANDVSKYLFNKNQTIDMFEDESPESCSSYYHLCE